VLDGVADVLKVVGDRWALQVVREVALGVRRFEEMRAATGAPRTVLSDRLRKLSEAGILATRPYQEPGRRQQREYVLTAAGLDLLPVLVALTGWGERHLGAGADPAISYRHFGCGGRVDVTIRCECGEAADSPDRLIAQVNR
jgi:DNA-binding HxlR family transcriptional regulator